MYQLISLLLLATLGAAAEAAIQSKAIVYEDEGTPLTGYLYWDDANAAKRPGVLVLHEWWGLNAYAKQRARMLAELGYVAFAADMYGEGRVTQDPKQASEWMQEITADPELWRQRATRGLEQLQSSPLVASEKLAAVGYCFGGGTLLQLAYGGGSPLAGGVSFHGSLPAAPPEAKGKITPRLLILHGQADSFIAPDVVTNFQTKLEEAGAHWEMDIYGGARHGFTNPSAGDYGIENLKYDALADARSWKRMQDFLEEILAD